MTGTDLALGVAAAALLVAGNLVIASEPAAEPWRVPDYPAPVATRQPVTSTGTNAAPPTPTPSPVASRASRSRSTGTTLDVTAYCWTGNRTASGAWPELGHAAVLDRSIPFGTRIEVPGMGVVTVTDRIGHSSGLDIYMGREGCQARAQQFGRQRLIVTLITPGARA
jgi:3D (Asp-Asp-Asp) domain-containing protein